MIGDPDTRYREDPVRIIRVVRFAAKLGFEIEPGHAQSRSRACRALLANVPPLAPVRRDGQAAADRPCAGQHRAAAQAGPARRHGALPGARRRAVAGARRTRRAQTFVRLALDDTDRRVAEGRAVAPSFMLACLLWHDVLERWSALQAQRRAAVPGAAAGGGRGVRCAHRRHLGPRQAGADMREIWLMQPRFERRTPSSAQSLVAQPRFRAGYDFLRLRADCRRSRRPSWPTGGRTSTSATTRSARPCCRTCARRCRRQGAARPAAQAAAPAPRAPAAARRIATADAAATKRRTAGARKRRRRRRKPARRGAGAAAGARQARSRHRRRGMSVERVFVGLGANLGDAAGDAGDGAARIGRRCRGAGWCAASSLYRSAPVDAAGPGLLNAVAETEHHAGAAGRCCWRCRRSRQAHGRERPYRNAPRTLDLDLLLLRPARDRRAGPDAAAPAPARARLRARCRCWNSRPASCIPARAAGPLARSARPGRRSSAWREPAAVAPCGRCLGSPRLQAGDRLTTGR